MNYSTKNFLPLVLVVLTASCTRITVPPVTSTPTGAHDTGRFIWLDLVTEDVNAVKKFYGGLFGWTFERITNDDTYTLILADDKPMGGIFFHDQLNEVSESRWVSYLSVPDVDDAVAIVRAQGGEIYVEPRDVPDRGRLAVIADRQGAVLALLTAKEGDPPPDIGCLDPTNGCGSSSGPPIPTKRSRSAKSSSATSVRSLERSRVTPTS